MSRSILKDLCRQPTLTAASSEKYAKLVHDATVQLQQIQHSTTQLQHSLESTLSALDLRAMALTQTANFESALDDAEAMQRISSSSALGYLREAMIYSEQGKQRDVVELCRRALRVVKKKDPHYNTLKRAKLDAEQQAKRRIDFISQLPVEIVVTTLLPMFVEHELDISSASYQYLKVSNQWADRIRQCLGEVSFNLYEEGDEERCSQVSQISQHIDSLHVHYFSKGTWLYDLLSDSDFSSLKKLYIDAYMFEIDHSEYDDDDDDDDSYYNGDQVDHAGYFISSLRYIGNTLTHFEVDMNGSNVLSLYSVVGNCPNLVSLRLMNIYHDGDPFTFHYDSNVTWPKMTTLAVTTTGPFYDEYLRDIVGHFPSLKRLEIGPCNRLSPAFFIATRCPSMRSVHFDIEYGSANITFSDQGHPIQEQGITELSIHGYSREIYSNHDIKALLRIHQSRLHFLQWDTEFDEENESMNIDQEAAYDIEFPVLKRLRIDNAGWWIPRNTPMLEELDITASTVAIKADILDTIPPKLQKLVMRIGDAPELESNTSIIDYLDRISQQCKLKDLDMEFYSEEDFEQVIDAICHLHQLERLIIRIRDYWDSHHMEASLDKLITECPLLTSLDIDCCNAPSTRAINTLKRLEHIKKFGFCVDDTGCNEGFCDAIQSFWQLKTIRIVIQAVFFDIPIDHLKEQRPDMEILLEDRLECLWN
ncbi:hypothetical protein LRAMOSA08981 [Lichtheimia ramosa]|uniref:Uncharacterized protein n=1 Tax=Lichtheimia ramosa TaxID=688394 RepID=A0A077WHF7_9FUNG|nr:hypothetical protein LRAMOSA08981 [Lichtheimia ramosa]